jgi:DHA2 family metal-tetracycline-proton antiporter-like MFS transporter
VYIVMLLPRVFPQSERVAAGVSYREMLAEAGFISAFIVAVLMVLELGRVFGWSTTVEWVLIALITIGYGLWARSPGKPLFIVMTLVMIPLAVTELGTDGWITAMMTPAMAEIGLDGGWVLIYAMALVLVLRLFAGPLVHKFSPLGLLAISAAIAAIGLVMLSKTTGVMLLLAATVYGIGKAFFWPTSLGVVAEQSPKGGAITLNVVAGVGMLAAGIVGSPVIGGVQDRAMVEHIREHDVKNGTQLSAAVTTEKDGMFGTYTAVDPEKRGAVSGGDKAVIDKIDAESKLEALRTIAILPVIMLLVYLGLILWFRSRGGYKPVVLELK